MNSNRVTKKVYVGEMEGRRRDGVIILSDLCTVFDVHIWAVCHRDDLQQLKICILY